MTLNPAEFPPIQLYEGMSMEAVTEAIEAKYHARRANGIRRHYLDAGSNPVVVLLHGFPETSFAWRFQIPVLARHYPVIAPDLRALRTSTTGRTTGTGQRIAGGISAQLEGRMTLQPISRASRDPRATLIASVISPTVVQDPPSDDGSRDDA